jgi:hypothetical protein
MSPARGALTEAERAAADAAFEQELLKAAARKGRAEKAAAKAAAIDKWMATLGAEHAKDANQG